MAPDDEADIRLDERRRIVRELRELTRDAPGATMHVRDVIAFLKQKREP